MTASVPSRRPGAARERGAFDTWRRCFEMISDSLGYYVIAIWASALVAALTQGNVLILKLLTDEVLAPMRLDSLPRVTLLIVVVYLGKGVASFIARHVTFLLGARFAYAVRKRLYEKLVRLPLPYFEAEKTGQILTRFVGDVAVVQNNTNVFYHSVKDILTVLTGVGVLLTLNAMLALKTFFVLPLVAWFGDRLAKKLRSLGQLSAQQTGEVTSFVQETVAGVREVQGFSVEARMVERFEGINGENQKVQIRSAKYQALSTPVLEMIVSVGFSWVVWAGCHDVVAGRMTAGGFMGFLVALGMLFEPLRKLSDVVNVLALTQAHADRFLDLLDEPETITEPAVPRSPERREGRVELAGVGFAYGLGEPVLDGISLAAAPGDVVALVGASGAGKSTLLKLLPRFYDVTAGAIRVDGIELREMRLAELRGMFGIVPQETVLFSGTIADNIAFGVPDAGRERIVQAARDANAESFILKFEKGYETQVGERGARLSGGERQRIAIARALLKDPRILILDEATSSLDSESERVVQEALERLMRSRTTFVIAHRLSTIQGAHQILVMAKGRIVERGTHAELMGARGEYFRLQGQQPRASLESAAAAAAGAA